MRKSADEFRAFYTQAKAEGRVHQADPKSEHVEMDDTDGRTYAVLKYVIRNSDAGGADAVFLKPIDHG